MLPGACRDWAIASIRKAAIEVGQPYVPAEGAENIEAGSGVAWGGVRHAKRFARRAPGVVDWRGQALGLAAESGSL